MNFRNSKQREAILEVLKREAYHPTVDEIYTLVKERFPRISLATVYRNLEQLCRMGKIGKVESAGAPARYDRSSLEHFHIKCSQCGAVADAKFDDKLENHMDLDRIAGDFALTGYRIDFYGLCPQCREN